MTDPKLLKQLAEIIRSHMTGCNTRDGSVCLSSPCRCAQDAAQAAIDVYEEWQREMLAPIPAEECDCQNPEGEGVRHISLTCPIHGDPAPPKEGEKEYLERMQASTENIDKTAVIGGPKEGE